MYVQRKCPWRHNINSKRTACNREDVIILLVATTEKGNFIFPSKYFHGR